MLSSSKNAYRISCFKIYYFSDFKPYCLPKKKILFKIASLLPLTFLIIYSLLLLTVAISYYYF